MFVVIILLCMSQHRHCTTRVAAEIFVHDFSNHRLHLLEWVEH